MTRFARAKGSKSSNERVPESATPWSIMKEEMQRTQQEKKDNKEREKIDKMRQENYNNFLKEQKTEVKNEWADFSDNDKQNKEGDIKIGKGVEKAKKKKEKKAKMSKDDICEMLKPDLEIDSQVVKLTKKIDKILKKEEKINKKKAKQQSSHNVTKNDLQESSFIVENSPKKKQKKLEVKSDNSQSNDDDTPMEVSAKIETPKQTVSKSKSKKKKTPLKIEPVKLSSENDQAPDTKLEKHEKNTELENNAEKSNENGEPQKLTKSMKKRLMKKKKLEAQKLLNPKPENSNDNKTKKHNNKKKSDTKNTNQDSGESASNNNNERFDNRKRKMSSDYEKPNKFPKKEQKIKVAKVRDNLEHKRRKPDWGPMKMTINGLEFEIVKFDGFPVKKEDADRLHELRKQMISKGIPRSEVKRTLQLERRKAEKALTREKKKVCFHCRKAGHMLSECPDLNKEESTNGTGICFKCGSTEHTHFECKVTKGDDFKFASCFICREQGHIARQCPDNPKGLYPQGGGCRICGDVTHLKKDCPQLQQEKEDSAVFLKTISNGNLEIDEDVSRKLESKPTTVKNKIVKF